MYRQQSLAHLVLFSTLIFSSITVIKSERMINMRNQFYVTSVKCINHAKTFIDFPTCILKPINRTVKVLSIRVVLLKPPVTHSHINFAALKKFNGYRPFLINMTIDICQYFAGKRNIMFNWFYDSVVPYSNINHTCPYVDDLIIDKLPVSRIVFPSIWPEGEYRLDLKIFNTSLNLLLYTVQTYIEVSEQSIQKPTEN